MGPLILIVDDDINIGNMVEEALTRAGCETMRAYSGTETLMVIERRRPDLVLLDLMLPGITGEEVLKKIQDIPVIVVSAKADINDKVGLLLAGAKDYVTKPFSVEELLARITVALRDKAATSIRNLSFQDIFMDTDSHRVMVAQTEVKLTKTEFAILKFLMQNPAQVIAKSVILDRISADTPDCMESSLKVHISNLRKKLKEAGGKDYIEAVWGIGFKMNEEA